MPGAEEKRRGATPPSPCDIGCSAHSSPRSRKRGRPIQCRAGISDRYIRRLPGRSHTADRHRRRSCDEAPETTPALRRRKPGTPIDPLQSASCGTPRDHPRRSCSIKPEETDQHVGDAGGKFGVVHVNVDRRVQRRRRPRPGRSGCARSASPDGHALKAAALRAGVHPETGRISAIFPGMRRLPNSTKTSLPDLGIDQALIGNVPVDKDIGRIEDFGDRRARHQRLADMRETCRNYSGDRRKDPALAEMRSTSSRRPRSCRINSSREAS